MKFLYKEDVSFLSFAIFFRFSENPEKKSRQKSFEVRRGRGEGLRGALRAPRRQGSSEPGILFVEVSLQKKYVFVV